MTSRADLCQLPTVTEPALGVRATHPAENDAAAKLLQTASSRVALARLVTAPTPTGSQPHSGETTLP
jgi:hypothetical protein